MKIRVGKRQRRNRLIVGWSVVAVLGVTLVGGGVVLYRARAQTYDVPSSIAAQLDFSPLVLGRTKGFKVSSYKYDKDNKVLSYVITNASTSRDITVTEQSQPAQFSEIAGYKDRFLESVVEQYATVQTSNGTVYLAHPSKQPDKQVALIIDRGLLVFMNPSDSLGADQWRILVEQLQVQKVL